MSDGRDPESQRKSERVTLALEIHYRSAGSFLVTFSVNLSRGGLFVETQTPLAAGTPIELRIFTPDSDTIALAGTVAWVRTPEQARAGQPPGMGIAVSTPEERYGVLVDDIATRFAGLKVLVALGAGQSKTRAVLHRHLASIVSCHLTDVEIAPRIQVSQKDFDLAVVDMDADASDELVARLRGGASAVPVIALGRWEESRSRAIELGAADALPALPGFPELRASVLRTLTQPTTVR